MSHPSNQVTSAWATVCDCSSRPQFFLGAATPDTRRPFPSSTILTNVNRWRTRHIASKTVVRLYCGTANAAPDQNVTIGAGTGNEEQRWIFQKSGWEFITQVTEKVDVQYGMLEFLKCRRAFTEGGYVAKLVREELGAKTSYGRNGLIPYLLMFSPMLKRLCIRIQELTWFHFIQPISHSRNIQVINKQTLSA